MGCEDGQCDEQPVMLFIVTFSVAEYPQYQSIPSFLGIPEESVWLGKTEAIRHMDGNAKWNHVSGRGPDRDFASPVSFPEDT